jgi:hypothetical protein
MPTGSKIALLVWAVGVGITVGCLIYDAVMAYGMAEAVARKFACGIGLFAIAHFINQTISALLPKR